MSTLLDLAPGATATLVIAGTVSPSAAGSLSNTAAAAVPAGWTDPVPGNNAATDVDVLQPRADLAVSKTDGQASAVPGQPVTYTVTVANNGPSDVVGAPVSDVMPAALTGVSWTCTVAPGDGACGAASGSGDVATTVDLRSGRQATFTVTGTVSPAAAGSLSNTAAVAAPAGWTDPTPGNNTATDTDTLAGSADLAVTKTDGQASATPGGPVSYTVAVANNGPSAVAGATVTDTVPAAVTGVSWTCSLTAGSGSCGSASGTGNSIATSLDLASGAVVTITVLGTVSPSASGTLSNTATVAPPAGVSDPVAGNNTATDTDTLIPQSDLAVTKSDGQSAAVPGAALTYTVAVTNNGPSAVVGATVTDTVPAALTGVSWTCAVTGGGSCGAASGSGNAVATTLDLASGAVATLTVGGTLSPSAAGSLSNTAAVAVPAGWTDPTPGNNTATDTDTLAGTADLAVTNVSAPVPYVAGAPITYTVAVTNNGPSAVVGATVADTVPAAVTGVTWTCAISAGSGSCGAASGSGNAIATGLDLASGAVATITVSGVVAPGTTGALTSTATVSAPAGVVDPVPGNNTAIDTNAASANADLAVTNVSAPVPYVAGAPITYTVAVTNNGPSAVVGATVADTVPAAVTGVTWTCAISAGSGSCGAASGSGNAIATGLDLASGAVATITVSGVVAPGTTGALTSTATVSAPAGVVDPVPGNNTAIDTNAASANADLAVTNVSAPVPYVAGAPITYTVAVTNNGPSAVVGATRDGHDPGRRSRVSPGPVRSRRGAGVAVRRRGRGMRLRRGSIWPRARWRRSRSPVLWLWARRER